MPIAHSRQKATEESVAAVCEQLFRSGKSITARAVHEALEGGHIPVIYRHIRTWEAKHREKYLMLETAVDLSAPAMKALTAIWTAAHNAATSTTQEDHNDK